MINCPTLLASDQRLKIAVHLTLTEQTDHHLVINGVRRMGRSVGFRSTPDDGGWILIT
jgi:hypothetical protein